MPEPEPRVDDADAAPGTNPVMPESEQATLSSGSDAPTTEAVAPEALIALGDEGDEPAGDSAGDVAEQRVAGTAPEAAPETDTASDVGSPDVFATGVLEIVSSLDQGDQTAPSEAAVAEPSAEVTAIATPVPADAEEAVVETPPAETADEAIVEVTPADAAAETPAGDDVTPDANVIPAEQSASVLAPEAATAPAAVAGAAEAELPRGRVPWWPFAAYLGLWVVGLGYAAYQFMQVPSDPLLYHGLYGYFVWGGVVLIALGPILIPFVWLFARAGLEKSQRAGLFARTAFWGALATLGGASMWVLTIVALDFIRVRSVL